MPVPQENSLFVEQASCLLSENSARCEFNLRCGTIVNKPFMNGFWGPCHKKI
ncbi:hypothetical protein [Microcoleus vaginatus]|uniref:hypothetical protein n=1 Tax=Microcoleus vaginatus TaxID=119532 RepID=UPI001F61305E